MSDKFNIDNPKVSGIGGDEPKFYIRAKSDDISAPPQDVTQTSSSDVTLSSNIEFAVEKVKSDEVALNIETSSEMIISRVMEEEVAVQVAVTNQETFTNNTVLVDNVSILAIADNTEIRSVYEISGAAIQVSVDREEKMYATYVSDVATNAVIANEETKFVVVESSNDIPANSDISKEVEMQSFNDMSMNTAFSMMSEVETPPQTITYADEAKIKVSVISNTEFSSSVAQGKWFLMTNGTSDYFVTPSFAYDTVEVDFETIGRPANFAKYLAENFHYIQHASNGTDNWDATGWGSVYVNDITATTNTDFIPDDTKITLKAVRLSSTATTTQFARNTGSSGWLNGKFYGARFYLNGAVVAKYDMTLGSQVAGTVQDLSGNGKHITLNGGTWVLTPQTKTFTETNTVDFQTGTLTNVTAANGSLKLTGTAPTPTTKNGISSVTMNSGVNGLTGEYGMQFRPKMDIIVTGLRVYTNSSDLDRGENLSLWDVSSGTRLANVTGSSPSSSSAWFTINLSTPVTITPGKSYIVSSTLGSYSSGFQANPILNSDLTFESWENGSSGTMPTVSTTNRYGLVDIEYHLPVVGTPGISSVGSVSGTTGTNQERGWEFRVGATAIVVEKLRIYGYRNGSSVNENWPVQIWDLAGTKLATVNVLLTGTTPGWFEATLPSNITLLANTNYVISTTTQNSWYYSSNATVSSGITNIAGRYNATGGQFPSTSSAGVINGMPDFVQPIALTYPTSGNRVSTAFDISSIGKPASSTISWGATTPTNTTVAIQTSVDNGATWQNATNGGAITNLGVSTNLIKVKELLTTTNTSATPSLDNLTITIIESDANIMTRIESLEFSPTVTDNAIFFHDNGNYVTLTEEIGIAFSADEYRIFNSIKEDSAALLNSVESSYFFNFEKIEEVSTSASVEHSESVKRTYTEEVSNKVDVSDIADMRIVFTGDVQFKIDVEGTVETFIEVDLNENLTNGTHNNTVWDGSNLKLNSSVFQDTSIFSSTNLTHTITASSNRTTDAYNGFAFQAVSEINITKLKYYNFGDYTGSARKIRIFAGTSSNLRVFAEYDVTSAAGWNEIAVNLNLPANGKNGSAQEYYWITHTILNGTKTKGINWSGGYSHDLVLKADNQYVNFFGPDVDFNIITGTSFFTVGVTSYGSVLDFEYEGTVSTYSTSGTYNTDLDLTGYDRATLKTINQTLPTGTAANVDYSVDSGATWKVLSNNSIIPGRQVVKLRNTLSTADTSKTPSISVVPFKASTGLLKYSKVEAASLNIGVNDYNSFGVYEDRFVEVSTSAKADGSFRANGFRDESVTLNTSVDLTSVYKLTKAEEVVFSPQIDGTYSVKRILQDEASTKASVVDNVQIGRQLPDGSFTQLNPEEIGIKLTATDESWFLRRNFEDRVEEITFNPKVEGIWTFQEHAELGLKVDAEVTLIKLTHFDEAVFMGTSVEDEKIKSQTKLEEATFNPNVLGTYKVERILTEEASIEVSIDESYKVKALKTEQTNIVASVSGSYVKKTTFTSVVGVKASVSQNEIRVQTNPEEVNLNIVLEDKATMTTMYAEEAIFTALVESDYKNRLALTEEAELKFKVVSDYHRIFTYNDEISLTPQVSDEAKKKYLYAEATTIKASVESTYLAADAQVYTRMIVDDNNTRLNVVENAYRFEVVPYNLRLVIQSD